MKDLTMVSVPQRDIRVLATGICVSPFDLDRRDRPSHIQQAARPDDQQNHAAGDGDHDAESEFDWV